MPRARSAPATATLGEPTVRQALRWIACAFVPSSLMLGVTTYLTTEIVAVPLLWVIPLAIYLLTYVLAFGAMSPRLHQLMVPAMPVGVVLILFVMLSRIAPPLAVVTVLHLGTLFLVGMVGHGELVRTRPDTPALTTFYLCIAFGGALGGLVHAVVAPLVFSAIVEYPLTLVLACLLLLPVAAQPTTRQARGLPALTPQRGRSILAVEPCTTLNVQKERDSWSGRPSQHALRFDTCPSPTSGTTSALW